MNARLARFRGGSKAELGRHKKREGQTLEMQMWWWKNWEQFELSLFMVMEEKIFKCRYFFTFKFLVT